MLPLPLSSALDFRTERPFVWSFTISVRGLRDPVCSSSSPNICPNFPWKLSHTVLIPLHWEDCSTNDNSEWEKVRSQLWIAVHFFQFIFLASQSWLRSPWQHIVSICVNSVNKFAYFNHVTSISVMRVTSVSFQPPKFVYEYVILRW